MASNISVDMDAVMAALTRLAELHDDPAFPTGPEMQHIEGSAVWPTAPFQAAMRQAAMRLGTRVTKTRGLLAESHADITQAVKELVANDLSLADDAVAILAALETVPTPAASTSSGTAESQTTSQAHA